MISLLVVNYRSAILAVDAIRSARAASSTPLHVVAVDNSLDADEAQRLRSVADFVVASARNAGYAGGINLGRPHCRGNVVVVTNPDVVFGERSIDRLVETLADDRYAAAGPALFWDGANRWLLPPADEKSLADKADEAMAARHSFWAGMRDRRRFRRRLAFWRLTETTRVDVVSGAVMAIRLEDFDAAGGFDERFPLYFEENDFFRRLRRMWRPIAYVPAAKCRHIYDQSAGDARAQASAAWATSELAYLEKWYGRLGTRAVMRFAREVQPQRLPAPAESLRIPRSGLVVEVSPHASFTTAAGLLGAEGDITLPEEVWACFRGDAVYARAVDAGTADTVASCLLTKG